MFLFFVGFQHIDVLFYYLRKKWKNFKDFYLNFTTTDNQFDQQIQSLFSRYLAKNEDLTLVTVDHVVAKYILGYFMMCNRVWFNVDHIFFPIYIGKEKHWVLGVLHIKDCHIYVHNTLRGAKYNKAVQDCIRSYIILLPLFFDVVNF